MNWNLPSRSSGRLPPAKAVGRGVPAPRSPDSFHPALGGKRAGVHAPQSG